MPRSPLPKPDPSKHDYPRMQLRRGNWTNLNGKWEFALDAHAAWTTPAQVKFDRKIVVPFSPETPASGVEETGFYEAVWYRRTFDVNALSEDQRLILHFGAVDHIASVWVNEALVATHEGGYTPFSADITDALVAKGKSQTIVVRAYDDPQDLSKPRGKQDWHRDPHSIWYYRTTGIWQTVWLELVPHTRIESLRWTPCLDKWSFDFVATLAGAVEDGLRIRVRLHREGKTLADDTYSVSNRDVARTIALQDGGIDDYRNDLLWWPHAPKLIDADVELLDAKGNIIDTVSSYTAMRSVSAVGDRFMLNDRPMHLKLVLDQGYWPDTGLTAPSDDALRLDVELVKQLGFNGVRKHQKIEDPRFLYWADVLGLMVWEEMPSAYRYSPATVSRVPTEWLQAMQRDVSHPCIVAWVPINESWGVPDLVESKAQRDFLRAIYHLTKAFDPTRPVIGNDGWEMVVSDIIAIHDYDGVPSRITQRYDRGRDLNEMLATERPGHRHLLLDDCSIENRPIMLTEFGGIAFHKDTKRTWGYKRAATAKEFASQYNELLQAVRSLPLFSGFCYTQFTDTYQEANGLLYMDRTPKLPIEQIARMTSG